MTFILLDKETKELPRDQWVWEGENLRRQLCSAVRPGYIASNGKSPVIG